MNNTNDINTSAPVDGSPLLCECMNWCRDGVLYKDMDSIHHPRCKHYSPPLPDPRFEIFGRLVWKWIEQAGGDFCGLEVSEDILPFAQTAGLCCRVIYDPEKHGENIEADPGCEIWFWGQENSDYPTGESNS